jgi:hypothetical protein
VIKLEGLVDMMELRIVYQNVLGKHGWKKSLERPRIGCLHNTKINVRDVGCETMDWIHMAVDLLYEHEAVCERNNEPLFSTEYREFLDQLSDC